MHQNNAQINIKFTKSNYLKNEKYFSMQYAKKAINQSKIR
ncbi:hypothetical protein N473_05430 [Pseudoalteromonas luteoviolacea CPMOR-1]|uniref:Uncharacterized protein n=1 Tax=Pseudoalteromonas luteoviolacea CPMOR-1 TaxID=1365248 RepID=A0A161YDM6_9GAMM|nr:hypothetical protein N473_05430 [Pseudoalteromonas luteoviolacea CPMOR-1]